MSDINCFNCTCRLTKDAEVRDTGNRAILSVSAAVNTGTGDYKKTLFIKVQKWGQSKESLNSLAQHLTKGTHIGVTGSLSREDYTAKNGNDYTDIVLTAHELCFIESKKQDSDKSSETKSEETVF